MENGGPRTPAEWSAAVSAYPPKLQQRRKTSRSNVRKSGRVQFKAEAFERVTLLRLAQRNSAMTNSR
jgi:hypothetical protein